MSDIKGMFPSRWQGGVILEADFSQLEVVGLAMLSRDEQLIADILSGMDTHTFWASKLFSKPESDVTKPERQIAKVFNFQLQYGSGARNMALSQGVKKALAESFIQMYYERYVGVKRWQERIAREVGASRTPYGVFREASRAAGLPRGRGTYESATGRIYSFLEQEPFRDGEAPGFSPTQMKNYPVQGFATGDVMALYRARVYRLWIVQEWRHQAVPINTVHDSVMFDCDSPETALKVKQMLERVAATLQEELESLWDIQAPVPFRIETKAGPTWLKQEKLNG